MEKSKKVTTVISISIVLLALLLIPLAFIMITNAETAEADVKNLGNAGYFSVVAVYKSDYDIITNTTVVLVDPLTNIVYVTLENPISPKTRSLSVLYDVDGKPITYDKWYQRYQNY